MRHKLYVVGFESGQSDGVAKICAQLEAKPHPGERCLGRPGSGQQCPDAQPTSGPAHQSQQPERTG